VARQPRTAFSKTFPLLTSGFDELLLSGLPVGLDRCWEACTVYSEPFLPYPDGKLSHEEDLVQHGYDRTVTVSTLHRFVV
jgi:hypothetical protein